MKQEDRKERARELVSQMTLEEKAGLCSGQDFWNLKVIKRLGIESIMMTDGPHGLRKQAGNGDHMGIGESVPAVCFPTASSLACSFDQELLFEIGEALGEECLQEEVSILLGPGVNQKRSPLCGRSFEYFSEDPLVSGELAASLIEGVQSKGIGTSLKHFAVNNQEKKRATISAVVDERALRETYLKSFEIAVKKAKPWTVMCAYNRVNGIYCSENEYLLTTILREEWGFEGCVVSDWCAVNDRVEGVKAGLDIEMPTSNGINDAKIVKAVRSSALSEEKLDQAVCRIVELILKSSEAKKKDYRYDVERHHNLAIRAAIESAVLLKNEDNILPGNTKQKAAIIGAFAKEPRYQGSGSSRIKPIKLDCAWDALLSCGLEAEYARGYDPMDEKANQSTEELLMQEACRLASEKDIVYLFAGLPDLYESEGFDRTSLSMPENQNKLIDAVASVNPNVVVILSGGAPMELSWAHKVKGILLSYLGGEGSGSAVAKLLLGKVTPCGKLAETWPLALADTPANLYFPGGIATVEYRESIYIGYRYYEAARKEVRYPFGYGLSYTDFSYHDLKVDTKEYQSGEKVNVTFKISNTGGTEGKETAMIFVAHQSDMIYLPVKELRAFTKVFLLPGETKQVSVALNTAEFAYYNTIIKDWHVEEGEYRILVGRNAEECYLQAKVYIKSPEQPQPDYREKAPHYYDIPQGVFKIPDAEFSAIYGKELPPNLPVTRPYHTDHTIIDIKKTLIGKLLSKVIDRMAKKISNGSKVEEAMMSAMLKEMPFHSMISSAGGKITEQMLNGIIDMANGHYLKGIWKLLHKERE